MAAEVGSECGDGSSVGVWPRFMLKVELSAVSRAGIRVFLYSPVVSIYHSLSKSYSACGVEVSLERVIRLPSQSQPSCMYTGKL